MDCCCLFDMLVTADKEATASVANYSGSLARVLALDSSSTAGSEKQRQRYAFVYSFDTP